MFNKQTSDRLIGDRDQSATSNAVVKQFGREENGFVLILFLLFLPVFMGVALLVLDMGRGNNAHSDLQAAADAVAIAGAVELDGSNGALDRSRAAMAELTNTVSMLSVTTNNSTIALEYEDEAGNPFTVVFLEAIPDSDDTPIDQAWITANATNSDADAQYVYVHAQSNDLRTFFPNPITLFTETVPISAVAVATNPGPVACEVTPIFICNPLEGVGTLSFAENFAAGNFYGRLFELHYNQSSTPGPGNFGFLRVDAGPGASNLREAIATGNSNTCYSDEGVDTQPGVVIGPVDRAINTHFGIYAGNYNSQSNNPLYRAAQNVRMGQSQTGNVCGAYEEEADNLDAMGLPRRTDASGNDDMVAVGGGFWSVTDDWNINKYWYVNHYWSTLGGGSETPQEDPIDDQTVWDLADPTDDIRAAASNTHPSGSIPSSVTPSRYDTYRYEIDNDLLDHPAPNGEIGDPYPQCTSLNLDSYTGPEYKERRTIFSAVINCNQYSSLIQGAATDIPTEAFVKMFLTKPSVSIGNDRYLSMEIIDSSGPGGLGTIDELFRVESVLVR